MSVSSVDSTMALFEDYYKTRCSDCEALIHSPEPYSRDRCGLCEYKYLKEHGHDSQDREE